MDFEKTQTAKDVMWRGRVFRPIASFVAKGRAGRFHVVQDAESYVLLGYVPGHGYRVRDHWFPEAVEAAYGEVSKTFWKGDNEPE